MLHKVGEHLQSFQIVKSHKHFVVHFRHFILAD